MFHIALHSCAQKTPHTAFHMIHTPVQSLSADFAPGHGVLSSSTLRVGADAVARGDARDRPKPHGGEHRVEGGAARARGA
eukprot:scaffold101695_cov42-Phaeocystis_antarctica.AAC.1